MHTLLFHYQKQYLMFTFEICLLDHVKDFCSLHPQFVRIALFLRYIYVQYLMLCNEMVNIFIYRNAMLESADINPAIK